MPTNRSGSNSAPPSRLSIFSPLCRLSTLAYFIHLYKRSRVIFVLSCGRSVILQEITLAQRFSTDEAFSPSRRNAGSFMNAEVPSLDSSPRDSSDRSGQGGGSRGAPGVGGVVRRSSLGWGSKCVRIALSVCFIGTGEGRYYN